MCVIGPSALSGPVFQWVESTQTQPQTISAVPRWLPLQLAAAAALGASTTCESVTSIFNTLITIVLTSVRKTLLAINMAKCSELASHIPATYTSEKLFQDIRAVPRLGLRATTVGPTALINVQLSLDLYRALTPEANKFFVAVKSQPLIKIISNAIHRRVSRCLHSLHRAVQRRPLVSVGLCALATATAVVVRRYTHYTPPKPPILMLEALEPLQQFTEKSDVSSESIFTNVYERFEDVRSTLEDTVSPFVETINRLEGTWLFFCMQVCAVSALGCGTLYVLVQTERQKAVNERSKELAQYIYDRNLLCVATQVYERKRNVDEILILPQTRYESEIDFSKRKREYVAAVQTLADSLKEPGVLSQRLSELHQRMRVSFPDQQERFNEDFQRHLHLLTDDRSAVSNGNT